MELITNYYILPIIFSMSRGGGRADDNTAPSMVGINYLTKVQGHGIRDDRHLLLTMNRSYVLGRCIQHIAVDF